MLGPGALGTPVGPGAAPLSVAPGGFAPLTAGYLSPLGAGFAAPTGALFPVSPYAAAPAFAPPAAFAAPPAAFAAPPASFAVPPSVFAAPQVAADRPVSHAYMEALRPTAQTIQGLGALLRQLEASLPLTAVYHSLHTQALQIPEIAAQPAIEQFNKASMDSLHAEIAAIGFIRRMMCGDFSAPVVQGVREQMRDAAKCWLESQVALREVLARPGIAQHPVIQVLRQAAIQAHQVRRVAVGQAQLLGIAPLPEGEEF